MAIDYTTELGQVRLLIADTTPGDGQVFTDEQIQAFLALATGVKTAAASALDVIASNEALVGKVIKTQDRSTDAAKVAAEIRAHAKALRAEAASDVDTGDDGVYAEAISDCDPCVELAEPWRYC